MKHSKKNRAGLTHTDIEKFRHLLLAKKAEILSSVWSMEDESLRKCNTDLSSIPMHMADLGSDNFELENTIGLVDTERKLLREIEDALERIEMGEYGVCEGMGEPIGKPRLHAIPWARYCVKCAELSEVGRLYERDDVGLAG